MLRNFLFRVLADSRKHPHMDHPTHPDLLKNSADPAKRVGANDGRESRVSRSDDRELWSLRPVPNASKDVRILSSTDTSPPIVVVDASPSLMPSCGMVTVRRYAVSSEQKSLSADAAGDMAIECDVRSRQLPSRSFSGSPIKEHISLVSLEFRLSPRKRLLSPSSRSPAIGFSVLDSATGHSEHHQRIELAHIVGQRRPFLFTVNHSYTSVGAVTAAAASNDVAAIRIALENGGSTEEEATVRAGGFEMGFELELEGA